jgi:YVTN family beta-propeller protein
VNGDDNDVAVLNTVTRQIETTIRVGREPQAAAISPNGERLYVTNFRDDSVSVIDLLSQSVITTIPLKEKDDGPNGIAVSPDDSRVYVVNFDSDSVAIIDTETNQPVGDSLELGLQPSRVAFAPDGRYAYISSVLDFRVIVLNTATLTPTASIDLFEEPDGVLIGPGGKRLYVAIFGRNGSADFIDVYSTVNNLLIASIEVGEGPFGLALGPPRP